MDPAGSGIVEVASFMSPEGLYDCCWNEMNPRQLVSASADGSICLWDLGVRDGLPLRRWDGHRLEVASVDWNFIDKSTFLSASWDGSVKLWSPEHATSPLAEYRGSYAVYNAIWSPHNNEAFASCSGDGRVRLWDSRTAVEVCTIAAHSDEALAVDFDK
jgi:peroxin-7